MSTNFLIGAIGASLLGLLRRPLMITQFRTKFPKGPGLVELQFASLWARSFLVSWQVPGAFSYENAVPSPVPSL